MRGSGEGLYGSGFVASFSSAQDDDTGEQLVACGESFGKHTKSAPLGRGALFMCCGIVDYLIMISSALLVDYFPVLLSALPVDVPKEE